MHRSLLLAAFASLLCACAAKKPIEPVDPRLGEVAVKTLQSADTDRYEEAASGEQYDYPAVYDENASPVYPDALLTQRLPPLRIKVRLVVDAAGDVTESSPLDPAVSADPAFFAAIQAAVREWKFTPLVRIKGGPGKTDILSHETMITYEGEATALPFHQDYEFTFSQRDGKGFVSMAAPDKPR